jgi:hypothetical protein
MMLDGKPHSAPIYFAPTFFLVGFTVDIEVYISFLHYSVIAAGGPVKEYASFFSTYVPFLVI